MTAWKHPDRPFILASQSPRRQSILSRMGYSFSVEHPPVDDNPALLDAGHLVPSLIQCAESKARSISGRFRDALVLGADTIVFLEGKILGKPEHREDAFDMLTALSGRQHDVYTGVSLVCEACDFVCTAFARTCVLFRRLSSDEIEEYLQCATFADKAGAYAIQEEAMTFVESIEGCYQNVVGLPISATISLFLDYFKRKDAVHAR